MAKGGKKTNWTPILLGAGALAVAYWQKDKILEIFEKAKGSVGMRSRAYVGFNALPYSYARTGQWYPYHQAHYSI